MGVLYKLNSVGIGGFLLSMMAQFLSNQPQQIVVDGCRNKLIYIVSGMPQDRVSGPLLFLLYPSELFPFLRIS